MKKFFLAMMALAAMAIPAKAATYQSVVFRMVDPSLSMCIHMEDNMTLKVVDSNITMESDLGKIELPINEVTSWNFSTDDGASDHWAGIDGITPDTPAIDIRMTADKVILSNLASGTAVALYNVSGLMMHNATAGSEPVEISLAGLEPGVYVLTFANQSLKLSVGL